jgi:polo-like kinase 1
LSFIAAGIPAPPGSSAKNIRLKVGTNPAFGGKGPQADLWVTKWVDYSSKYGLGYLLLNGATGVYFNDSTKIILSPCGTYFDYIEKSMPGGGNGAIGSGGSDTDNVRQDVLSSYKMEQYPKELTKKVALLQ